MIETSSFKTRARTIDHLGREQIADCPTAISELWKNAYDAYARKVSLDLYDVEMPVAVISDNGHGMNISEIKDKWLIVGTESKATGGATPEADRNGLNLRPRQGQKGIGRLSCGYLGSLLLLISKRAADPYCVALIDWRIFQNPYLLLQDIRVPIATFDKKEEIFPALDKMRDRLMGNVWGDHDDEPRTLRIQEAWDLHEELERSEADHEDKNFLTTRAKLESTIISSSFNEDCLQEFDVWKDRHDSGTALIVGNLDYSLECLLQSHVDDSISRHTRKRFFETLTAFADPFVEKKETGAYLESEFEFSASTWKNGDKHVIVGASKQLSIDDLLILEHIIKGRIDSEGVFHGRVKSFGKWLDGEITIEAHEKHVLGKRSDTRLGPFDIFLASYERDPKNTTHTNEEIAHIKNLAKLYAGFMVYRDGLRVMPYGRADNDFFEIEQRRSLNAGREFWNHRNMFGKVAISKWQNPNIRDKAGREGIVDNRASKSLKDIVSNILMESSRRFFGSSSDIRQESLPGIQEANKVAKLELERKALNAKLRREFRSNLKRFLPELIEDYNQLRELENLVSNSSILRDEATVLECRERLQNTNERIGRFRLGQSPKKLGTMEKDYLSFREAKNACQKIMSNIGITLSEAVDALNPKSPKDIALSDLQRQAQYINRRTGAWLREIKKILESEGSRIEDFVKSRNRILQDEFLPVVDDVEHGRVSLKVASSNIEKRREALDIENEEIFEPYLATIQCLQERIDLTGLAGSITEEIADLRDELNRLNELAQLGIAVEIAGHELETYDATIGDGLNRMPDAVKQSRAFLQLKASYVNMSDKLRYLAPLKISGDRILEWITGEHIHEYVSGFFDMQIKERKIDLIPSNDFLKFKIFDLSSRVLPVFINLVNNSIYWVGQQEGVRVIRLSVEKDKIFVSDNGPGVSDLDLDSLFTLFFTKKIRDGRGVGLYLCRSNLAAGGHRIEYVSNPAEKIENGANFAIAFKGAVYG